MKLRVQTVSGVRRQREWRVAAARVTEPSAERRVKSGTGTGKNSSHLWAGPLLALTGIGGFLLSCTFFCHSENNGTGEEESGTEGGEGGRLH